MLTTSCRLPIFADFAEAMSIRVLFILEPERILGIHGFLHGFLLLALIPAAVATRRAAAKMVGNGVLGNLVQGGPERPYFSRR